MNNIQLIKESGKQPFVAINMNRSTALKFAESILTQANNNSSNMGRVETGTFRLNDNGMWSDCWFTLFVDEQH